MTIRTKRTRARTAVPQLPPSLSAQQRAEAIALLRSWREVDEEGARAQQETGEFLMAALDEDRTSYRARFSER